MTTLFNEQPALVQALLSPSAYPFPCSKVELVETHISWVLLTGEYAYKLKKPVDMGFLDFTSLAKRLFFCQEELRLNSRLSRDFYLGVVPITGTPRDPRAEGQGEPVEYAVKMRQFDQSGLLGRQLTEGRLRNWHVDRLADVAAAFHGSIARSGPSDPHGTPALSHEPCLENFEQIGGLIRDLGRKERLLRLKGWTEQEFDRLESFMASRKRDGFVRECHGDLHLGNVTQIGDEIVMFDGIEFNENFRWIDVMSEIAFLFTDLEHRGRPDLAWRVLSRYLEATGDFAGLRLLAYYRLHRVMVRTKVDAFRMDQPGVDSEERSALEAELDLYFVQAEATVGRDRPQLVLTRGLSGSGKSFLSQRLLQCLGAVRLRSDVERKRLYGLAPMESSDSPQNSGIYSDEATDVTFRRLLELAHDCLAAGYPTIVDATFLEAARIEPFRELAAELGLPFHVLDMRAPTSLLRARLAQRASEDTDASEAGQQVLTSQLLRYLPLQAPDCVAVDAERDWQPAELLALLGR